MGQNPALVLMVGLQAQEASVQLESSEEPMGSKECDLDRKSIAVAEFDTRSGPLF